MHVYWHQIDPIIDRVFHFYKGDKKNIALINFKWASICLSNYLPISINCNEVFFRDYKIFNGMHNYIKVLHCNGSDISNVNLLKAMSCCRYLEVVDFSYTKSVDLIIGRCLSSFNIISVNFKWCISIDDASVEEIVKCKSLTYLNLTNCFKISILFVPFFFS